jgi:hypothetical protein
MCGECGGTVDMLPAVGETREFRTGTRVEIPRGTPIPKCGECGEIYFSRADDVRIDKIIRRVVAIREAEHYRECVARLQRTRNVTVRDIERACGVTATYLSHVMGGRRVPSATLTRLLEAFVACPSELERHLSGATLAGILLRTPVSDTKEARTYAPTTWTREDAANVNALPEAA